MCHHDENSLTGRRMREGQCFLGAAVFEHGVQRLGSPCLGLGGQPPVPCPDMDSLSLNRQVQCLGPSYVSLVFGPKHELTVCLVLGLGLNGLGRGLDCH